MARKTGEEPLAAAATEQLVPGPGAPPSDPGAPRQAPAAAVAVFLAEQKRAKAGAWVHLASTDRRAEEIGRALSALAPELEVLVLPPWDCLPFDRASPGRDVMGRRMAVLRRLSAKARARVLLISPESLVQRAPPAAAIAAAYSIAVGQPLDRDALFAFASGAGYVVDDRIDEPGEIALFGEVVDLFPADAAWPVRIATDADGVVSDLRTYDPISQRTDSALTELTFGPASELILPADTDIAREPGCEHRMAAHYGALQSLFDLMPKAIATQDALFAQRLAEGLEQIADAYEAHRMLSPGAEAGPEREGLYLTAEDVAAGLEGWTPRPMDLAQVAAAPSAAGARNPGRTFCELVEAERLAGRRVILAGLAHERRALARALVRGLETSPLAVGSWTEAQALEPGAVASLELDIDTGFIDPARRLTVIAASDVLGGRLAARSGGAGRDLLVTEPDLRLGDVVLHEDHGVGVLRALELVEVDGVARDTLRLEYHGGASVLAPVEEIGRIWRYGAEEAAVSLDRLKGDAWPKRRADVSRHLDAVAAGLVALARIRASATCEPIVPPAATYARFAARFGYPETPDQAAAIAAVLQDLASGKPMDRLVCGDVGFGKTEVALRAAAAVALSGRQVALCAPTTVLARQHFQTFQRRFAQTGIKVEQLSRLIAARDAKTVREAIASGDAQIIIGTHALAGEQVAFADLGLMIIDEEQKFGAAVKQRLRDLARDGHLLSMTATPIPRTLQAAMIGVQDVSVIASPPARRRPIRTFLAPFDPASVRTALLREKRRGGQSFLVAPRIDDIAPLASQLKALTPELSMRIAHGALPADEVDSVMVGFAEGEGDILLATNIIESGLDVPRANTMIIWRPDRFGLSQLHQLRGRVGRGRAQGITYLLHDAAEALSEATRARLSTLEAFDRLGSGLAISARDLDLRGGGDLTGEDQAGHMQMIGASLYHRLLEQAIRSAQGEPAEAATPPSIHLGERGMIPVEHVPDAVTRINLYGRLARLTSVGAIDDFEDELQDRFGPLPPPLAVLLFQARLSALARAAGVTEIVAGPKAVAMRFANGRPGNLHGIMKLAAGAAFKGERLIVPLAMDDVAARGVLVERALTILSA
jgi:transcription-repair coupling factor (superfamily II helicase)